MIERRIKERLFENPDVTSVGYGFKYTAGVRTNVRCIIVGVKNKKPRTTVRPDRLIRPTYQSQLTDVQQKDVKALSFTGRMRTCPPGFSIGHTSITAGTLGAYVRRGEEPEWWILSNNHVLAASNQGKMNDTIIQPGKADGGFSGSDRFAWLREFVKINWDAGDGDGCNIFNRLMARFRRVRVIEQPSPNLVDAALALPVIQSYVNRVNPVTHAMATDFTRFELGDEVIKVGRTTEFTQGTVEGVDTMVRVRYDGGTATFDDQIEIRSPEQREFSAGGDSGSCILTTNGKKIGALLFAGAGPPDPVTIANRIGNVVNLMGITI